MIVAAAFCPPAPLLVPGLAVDLADELADLLAACRAALRALADADRIVVLCTGSSAVRLAPGDIVSSAAFSRSDHPAVPPVRLPGSAVATSRPPTGDDDDPRDADSGGARLGAGAVVAGYLLHEAGLTTPAWVRQLPAGPGPIPQAAMVGLGGAVASDGGGAIRPHRNVDGADRVGLLVMVNGSAAHSEHAPGGDDPRSPAFDADLVAAVGSGDPAILATRCAAMAGLAAELHDDTWPALSALTALTLGADPAAADVLHYSAPLGIGYLAATWRWRTR